MRDLDSINPAEAKPSRFVGVGAIIPIIFGVFGALLAGHAAPDATFLENPILILSSIVVAVACVMLPVPRLFKWNWEARFFGVPLFYLGSLTLICVIPCFCLVLYSKLSIWIRIFVFILYFSIHVAWVRRFVVFYRKINRDSVLRAALYEEEDDAVYYMQRGDKCLLETQYKFNQLPRDRYLVLSLLLAFSLTPVMDALRTFVGLPFIHIFFLIGTLPISLMGTGFATRGWLVFYCYPMQIRKNTGKRVYVDMSGKPNLSRQRKSANTA